MMNPHAVLADMASLTAEEKRASLMAQLEGPMEDYVLSLDEDARNEFFDHEASAIEASYRAEAEIMDEGFTQREAALWLQWCGLHDFSPRNGMELAYESSMLDRNEHGKLLEELQDMGLVWINKDGAQKMNPPEGMKVPTKLDQYAAEYEERAKHVVEHYAKIMLPPEAIGRIRARTFPDDAMLVEVSPSSDPASLPGPVAAFHEAVLRHGTLGSILTDSGIRLAFDIQHECTISWALDSGSGSCKFIPPEQTGGHYVVQFRGEIGTAQMDRAVADVADYLENNPV